MFQGTESREAELEESKTDTQKFKIDYEKADVSAVKKRKDTPVISFVETS